MPRIPGGRRLAPRQGLTIAGRTGRPVARQVGHSTYRAPNVATKTGGGGTVPGQTPRTAAPTPTFTATPAPVAPAPSTPAPAPKPAAPTLPWDTQGLLGQSGLLGAAQTADAGFDAREHSIYNRYGLNPDGTPTADPYSISALLREQLRKDRDALVQSQYAGGHGLDGSALLQGAFQGQDQARRTADVTRQMLDAIGAVEAERSASHSSLLGDAAKLIFGTADNAAGDQTYTGTESADTPAGATGPNPATPAAKKRKPPQGHSHKTLTVKAKAKGKKK